MSSTSFGIVLGFRLAFSQQNYYSNYGIDNQPLDYPEYYSEILPTDYSYSPGVDEIQDENTNDYSAFEIVGYRPPKLVMHTTRATPNATGRYPSEASAYL